MPLLDGRVARLSLTDGAVRGSFQLRVRPMGDAASLRGHVAIALDTTVAIFTDADAPTYVTIDAAVSAGVLASHDAFWVGDVRGGVTRIDTSGGTRVFSTGSKSPIVGLAAGKDLVYALSSDGVLVAVDGAATTPIRWRRADIGDTVGRPAEAHSWSSATLCRALATARSSIPFEICGRPQQRRPGGPSVTAKPARPSNSAAATPTSGSW